MGYDTTFDGVLDINPHLNVHQVAYVQGFNKTRHMPRETRLIENVPDPLRTNVGLPLGDFGMFYLGDTPRNGIRGQNWDKADPNHDLGIIEHGSGILKLDPRKTLPDLWCQWTVNDAGSYLEWDQGEKFYNYTEWLDWMIRQLFVRWRRTLNGTIAWRGESFDDIGKIIVVNNQITVKYGS